MSKTINMEHWRIATINSNRCYIKLVVLEVENDAQNVASLDGFVSIKNGIVTK